MQRLRAKEGFVINNEIRSTQFRTNDTNKIINNMREKQVVETVSKGKIFHGRWNSFAYQGVENEKVQEIIKQQ
mgnify:CR=1 FL=1